MALSLKPVTLSAATVTLSREVHSNTLLVVDRAAGVTATLPAATGTGDTYEFWVKTTITSNNFIVQVTGDDTMTGTCLFLKDSADTVDGFETASDSDTITMNGSTKGGIKGDRVVLKDIATDLWGVSIVGSATGTEATPFSAAVS